MKISLKQFQWNDCVPLLLIATVFFIPISPSLKSVFWIASALCILLTSKYRQDLPFVFSQNVTRTAIFFLLVVVLGCLWTKANYHTCLIFIDKYSKLLYLPILAVGFRSSKVRMMGIHAFLLAMFLTCILLFVPVFNISKPVDAIFHNHIITSFMMALAAYFSAIFLFRSNGYLRIAFVLLFSIFSYYLLFVNTGRAGYIIYFALSIMALIQSLPLKQIVAATLCFCSLFAVIGYQSNVVSKGFNSVIAEVANYNQGQKETSVGFRLTFHQFSKSLFLSSPWIGQGTGGFAYAFQNENKIPQWNKLLDPHSQYWLVASDLGVLGLAALFAFFASLWAAALSLREMKPILLGTWVALLLGNLTDSLLFYSAAGHLFIIFSALSLGELVENHERALNVQPVFVEAI